MIFSDFKKALAQVTDPRFLGVLLRGLGLTIALLAALTWGVQLVLPDGVVLPYLGEVVWMSKLLSGFALVAMIGLSVILMVPVAALFTGLFLETIADAVEQRFYPHLPIVPRTPLRDLIIDSVKFAGLIVVVNLFALIIYFASTLLAPVIFWIVNGLLLGREYFQLVAMRRLGREGANKLRAQHRMEIWLAGTLMAMPLSVPVVNLLVPILGVATFTHMFHRLNRLPGSRDQ